MEDWRGGKPLSLARSAGPPPTSAEACQSLGERGRELMGSYWSGRSWHCVAVEVVSGAVAEEERSQRWR